jgi:hypothetical protein
MNEDRFGNEMEDNILMRIHEGMIVYDRNDKELGTVDHVYFGSVSEESTDRGEGPAETTRADAPGYVDDAGEVFGMAGEDPAAIDFAFGGGVSPSETSGSEVRERLLRHGFIRLDSRGLFASDRYILPDQIASVSEDGVRLKLSKDELKNR